MKKCPVCGCCRVSTTALVKFIQNDDGDMIPELDDQEEVNNQVTWPNNVFKCENAECGIPSIDGKQIDPTIWEFNNGDLFTIWCVLNNLDYDKTKEEYETSCEEETNPTRKAFHDWVDSLEYEPWEGLYAELVD